jgi:hypothetical protein
MFLILVGLSIVFLQACTFHLYEMEDSRPQLRNTYRTYYTPRYTPRPTYRYLDFYDRYDTRIVYRYPRYLGPVVVPQRRIEPKEDPRPPRRAVPRPPVNRDRLRPETQRERRRIRPPVRDTIR